MIFNQVLFTYSFLDEIMDIWSHCKSIRLFEFNYQSTVYQQFKVYHIHA